MIRRIVLWEWIEGVTAEQRLRAKEGLAYISYASNVHHVDFGEDLGIGEPSNFGFALERDHVGRDSWDEYDIDPHHARVGSYIDSITNVDRTTRIDFEYKGPHSVRGAVRHIGLFTWADAVPEGERVFLQGELETLPQLVPSVRGVAVGDDLEWRPNHADWVLEVHFDDQGAFVAFRNEPAAQRLLSRVADLTSQAAQIEHRMLSG